MKAGNNITWYENLKSALQDNNLTTQIVAADTCCGDSAWGVATDMKNNSAFNNAVDIVGGHYPNAYQSSADAQSLGKPVWASEDGSQSYDSGAFALARSFNRNYIVGKMTATINWSLIASWYNNLPYAGNGLMLAKSIWVAAQTTQFTAPGWAVH